MGYNSYYCDLRCGGGLNNLHREDIDSVHVAKIVNHPMLDVTLGSG